jgi:hypothetical protein
MRTALFAFIAATSMLACAHKKPAGPQDRLVLAGQFMVRVPEAEAWELATVVAPADGDRKKMELLPSGTRIVATPMRVRSPAPAELVPGATVYWTNEAKDGDVERLRKADWQRGTIRRVVGTTVMVGEGKEADANWHVLVPLLADQPEAEPNEPK